MLPKVRTGAKIGVASNSSAPMSGLDAPPFTDPTGPGRNWLSISLVTNVTPTGAPADSNGVAAVVI